LRYTQFVNAANSFQVIPKFCIKLFCPCKHFTEYPVINNC